MVDTIPGMQGYKLDAYATAWAEMAAATIDAANLDKAEPFSKLGAGRMEDFELVRGFFVYAQGSEATTVPMGVPDCRLPNDGNANLYDEDPVAYEFLRANLPEEVKATVDEDLGDGVEPDEWVASFQESGEDWEESFGDVMRSVANDLHLEALLQLKSLLETRGYSFTDDCSIELSEHDSVTVLADEPGYEQIAVGQPFELGPWLDRKESVAALYFDSEERRQAFVDRAEE